MYACVQSDTHCVCRSDQCASAGVLLCAFQLYRVLLLPFANTWMLWSLLDKLAVPIPTALLASLAALLATCYRLSMRHRALMHVPVQLVAMGLSAAGAARCCPAQRQGAVAVGCAGGTLAVQVALSALVPAVIAEMAQASAPRTFLPHVQAKRSLFQPP